MNMNNEEDL